ncbi:translation initiation factor IF-2 [Ovis canadensis]|uniref:translation initiation factor IF-2 n=1 Tax=Ovis canadensis TaxID=37174 RepID=UPI0037501E60
MVPPCSPALPRTKPTLGGSVRPNPLVPVALQFPHGPRSSRLPGLGAGVLPESPPIGSPPGAGPRSPAPYWTELAPAGLTHWRERAGAGPGRGRGGEGPGPDGARRRRRAQQGCAAAWPGLRAAWSLREAGRRGACGRPGGAVRPPAGGAVSRGVAAPEARLSASLASPAAPRPVSCQGAAGGAGHKGRAGGRCGTTAPPGPTRRARRAARPGKSLRLARGATRPPGAPGRVVAGPRFRGELGSRFCLGLSASRTAKRRAETLTCAGNRPPYPTTPFSPGEGTCQPRVFKHLYVKVALRVRGENPFPSPQDWPALRQPSKLYRARLVRSQAQGEVAGAPAAPSRPPDSV